MSQQQPLNIAALSATYETERRERMRATDYRGRLQAIKERRGEPMPIITESGFENITLESAEAWLQERGVWRQEQRYLHPSDVPRALWTDVAMAQAHLAEAYAQRQTDAQLRGALDHATGDTIWIAEMAEAQRRGLL